MHPPYMQPPPNQLGENYRNDQERSKNMTANDAERYKS